MLEDPMFLVSRDLLSACEQESKGAYNAFCVAELAKGKRSLEDREVLNLRKPFKPLDRPQDFHSQSLSDADQSDNERHRDQSDSSSLINQIGRDLSINCLLHCSRSDYGSIALLNRSFRSLINNGEIYRLRRLMGIVEHWVYFSCNLLEWEAYDPIQLSMDAFT